MAPNEILEEGWEGNQRWDNILSRRLCNTPPAPHTKDTNMDSNGRDHLAWLQSSTFLTYRHTGCRIVR